MKMDQEFFNHIVQTTQDNQSNYNAERRALEKSNHGYARREAKKIAIKQLIDDIVPLAKERVLKEAKLGEVDANVYTISTVDYYDHIADNGGKRFIVVPMENGKEEHFQYRDLINDEAFKSAFEGFRVFNNVNYESIFNIKLVWGSHRRYNNDNRNN